MRQDSFNGPVNIGSEEMIAINDLATMVINISEKNIAIKNINGPVGVRGRNSDNTLFKEKMGWAPSQPLYNGIQKTYSWIKEQINEQ
jgi:nucleoside-diphosphate-sugar epimerase